jgi:uncharacterized membrane protein YgdD (TMEM256/DUF423 family)
LTAAFCRLRFSGAAMNSALSRLLLALAALSMAAATALGAYASHGLTGRLDSAALTTLWIGIAFQFFHTLGIAGLALVIDRRPESRLLKIAALAIAAGMLGFCGGLYASSLGGPRSLVSLAPIGGTTLIAAWLLAAASLMGGGFARRD